MSYLDQKYIALSGPRLDRFKKKTDTLYNFRCPYCGDSKKRKSIARGYFYSRAGQFYFACHNGCRGKIFRNFLKEIFPDLYKEYSRESYLDWIRSNRPETITSIPEALIQSREKDVLALPTLRTLSESHSAMRFCKARQMPDLYYDRLLYAENFFAWANHAVPGKYQTKFDEPRIVIPFTDGYQGRSLGQSRAKYVNVQVDESQPHFFGYDDIDPQEPVYVLEGPFDAMFLKNSIATGGGDLVVPLKGLQFIPVIVYDNERRNKQTVSKMLKAANLGYRICVWPETIIEKDINEMILAGKDSVSIKQIIDASTYSGQAAIAKIMGWMRVASS